jgi:hypothetical protein
MVRHVFFLSLLAGILLVSGIASAGVTLVQDGKPACTIVIAGDAGSHEKMGANDLQLYLSKMSGAKVPITSDASVKGNRILLGVYGKQPVQEWLGDRPSYDAFAIETRPRSGGGTDLLLVGGDPRGAEYAVYELLERSLGVRWYCPGEIGEEVPAHKTVELGDIKWSNKADFEAITGFAWHGSPGAYEWVRHNKAEVGSPTYFFGHAWASYINPTEENRKAHPEWFALQPDGSRGEQLCTTNPEVLKLFINAVMDNFDHNPDAMLASIGPNDGDQFCTCDKCRAVDAQYGVTDGSHTDRLVDFANKILKETKKKHPDKLVGILAYVSYTRPPVSAVPDPNYVTMICHTPWEFCNVHPIGDPNCVPNTKFRENIEGWAKVCKHVSMYEYYGSFYGFTPFPILHTIGVDMPYMRRIGVSGGFMDETDQNWANQGIGFFLAAKLAWDADRKPKEILDDFYRGFYGPAEKPMRKYWEIWESEMPKQKCQGYAWFAMFTPEILKQTGPLLDEAEKLAAGNERVLKRLALNRTGFRFSEAFVRMQEAGKAGDVENTICAGAEALKVVRDSMGTEPMAFSDPAALDQTEIQLLQYKRWFEAGEGRNPAGPKLW